MSLYIGNKKVTGIQSFIQENAKWGQIEGTLSDQTDLAEALADKYDASNPDGFITQDALAPYQPRAQEIIILETSGNITLLDNTINSINVSDNVTFTLPLREETLLKDCFTVCNFATSKSSCEKVFSLMF